MSESNSEAAAQSEAENNQGGEEEITDDEPAGEVAPVAETQTVEVEELLAEPASTIASVEVIEAAEEGVIEAAEEGLVEVEDEEVPLAVIDLEPQEELVQVEDEEVPLAEVELEDKKSWWWLLLAIAAAITGKTVYDKKNKKVTEIPSDEEQK